MTFSPSPYKWCKTRWIRTILILKWYTNSHVTTIIQQMSCMQGKQNFFGSLLKSQSLSLPLDSTSTTSSPSPCLLNDSSLHGTRVTNLQMMLLSPLMSGILLKLRRLKWHCAMADIWFPDQINFLIKPSRNLLVQRRCSLKIAFKNCVTSNFRSPSLSLCYL